MLLVIAQQSTVKVEFIDMTWCWQLIVATVAVIIVFKLRSSLIYNVKFILGYSYVLGTAALLVPFLILRPKKVENLV